jgi:hypothetical protein
MHVLAAYSLSGGLHVSIYDVTDVSCSVAKLPLPKCRVCFLCQLSQAMRMAHPSLQAHKALSKKKHELENERHQVEKLQKKFSLIHKTLVASTSLTSP